MLFNNLTTRIDPSTEGYSCSIGAAIIWGLNGAMMQFLVTERSINIEWLICLRLMVPGIVLLFMAWLKPGLGLPKVFSIWKKRKDALALIVFSVALMAVQYTFIAAIKASNAATAVVLQFTAPALIVIYYAFQKKKWPKTNEWIAISMVLIGTGLLATRGNIHQLNLSPAAIFWGIGSAFALAIYSVQPIRLLKEFPTLIVIGWGMLLGAIWIGFFHAPWAVEGIWDGYTWLYFLFIILIGGLLAFTMYLHAVKLIGAYLTTLLISIEPLTVTLVSVIWLKIAFGPMEIIGGTCIISTVFLLTKKKAKRIRPFRKHNST